MKRLATLLMIAAPFAAAAQTQGVSKDEIVVGTIQDLSGPLAALGTHFRNSLQMRFDEVNAEGGQRPGQVLNRADHNLVLGYALGLCSGRERQQCRGGDRARHYHLCEQFHL